MTAVRARIWWRLVAALLALSMVAAACGGGDDGGGGDGDGDGAGGVVSGEDQDDPDADLEPVRGGSLTFAREAETSSPWTPSSMVCDLACHQAISGIYDTLMRWGPDRTAHPFLLESMEPNEDFTQWTLTAREGITFHDGTPFDSEALDVHFTTMRDSVLVGNVFLSIESHEVVDDMTLQVNLSSPWAALPETLTAQPGYVASPTWLAAVEDGSAEATEPVGTGPFMFDNYESGSSFTMVRNPDYWLMAPDGEPYPYLDEIEFVVQEENRTRDNAMISGDIDITHMDSGDSTVLLRDEAESGTFNLVELTKHQQTGYLLINNAADAPVSDVRIRRAMAMAIDYELYKEARAGGVHEIANGPFPPGSDGFLEDTGYPTFDPDGARALVEEYEEEVGPATISYKTVTDPFALQTAELIQGMWEDVGFDVQLDQIEQGSFITDALQGNFEVFAWRNHAGRLADNERVWWASETALPQGEIALNFGRIDDEVIDEQLDTIRQTQDPDEVLAATEAINQQFGEQVYNIWLTWVPWVIPHQDDVHGVLTPVQLPDGSPSEVDAVVNAGSVNLMQLWVDQ